jgi:hypothetical protein
MTFYEQIRSYVTDSATNSDYTGVQVTRTPVTKTVSNSYGDETLTDGTDENIDVYFTKKTTDWWFDKEGEVEGGDAFMMTKYNQTINKNDKITYEGNTYRVKMVIDRVVNGEIVGKDCNLFLIE